MTTMKVLPIHRSGTARPIIAETSPSSEAVKGEEALEVGPTRGKIVIDVAG